MKILSTHRVPFTIIVGIVLLVIGVGAIFWARGFKPNFKDRTIERTGLLVVSSTPTGAQVYLDDRLTSATDTSIAFLEPKNFKVRIEKDGYTTWEKEVPIREDLATEIKALLFPVAPEIRPLTTTGAANPTLAPDISRLVYGASGEKGGLYLLPLSDRPFSFRQDARQIAKNQGGLDFSKANFIWSPNSKEVIATFKDTSGTNTANLILDTDSTNDAPRDITATLKSTIDSWQAEIDASMTRLNVLVPDSVKDATSAAELVDNKKPTTSPRPSPTTQLPSSPTTQLNYYPNGLIFSPDEEKILYKDKEGSPREAGKYHVYDTKLKKDSTLPALSDLLNITWFPDSNHLVVAQNGQISVIETDGANKMTVFSGKYENGFVFAHPSGTRLIVLTTLTQTDGTLPNLYAINLR